MASSASSATGGVQAGALLDMGTAVPGIWDVKATTAVAASLLVSFLYAAAHLHAVDRFRGMWVRGKFNLTS